MNYNTPFNPSEMSNRHRNRSMSSQIFLGVVIALVGLGILLSRMDFPIPHWILSWKMFLIVIGIFIGLKSRFRDINWIFPMMVGGIFLIGDLFPEYNFQRYGWPVGIIVIGMIIALKPHRIRRRWMHDDDFTPQTPSNTPPPVTPSPGITTDDSFETSASDSLDVTAVFGGAKRNLVSKNFQGGSIVAVMGGAEINLTHADIQGTVKLEAVNIMGGTKLIVPPTWDVQSEMVAIFGGVDDKRNVRPEMIDRNKRLILEGTCFMGGLEIKSY